MTFDHGAGYLFGSTMEGITLIGPDPKLLVSSSRRADQWQVVRREWRDGIAAKGEHTMFYDFNKPGLAVPLRKVAYAAAIPAGTCISEPAPISKTSTPN